MKDQRKGSISESFFPELSGSENQNLKEERGAISKGCGIVNDRQ